MYSGSSQTTLALYQLLQLRQVRGHVPIELPAWHPVVQSCTAGVQLHSDALNTGPAP